MALVAGARIAMFGAVCTAIGSTIVAACGGGQGGGTPPVDGGGYGYDGGGYAGGFGDPETTVDDGRASKRDVAGNVAEDSRAKR